MADNDRMVYQRASDKRWVDKRNGASRGFLYDTQRSAADAAKQHLLKFWRWRPVH